MGVVSTQGLTVQYPRVRALDALTVEIPEGITGVVGVNGAGKSTLIKVLLGLLRPTSGQVQVLGMDPTTHGPQIRELVGYMPEHDCLPADVSAAEFVMHMAMMSGLPRAAARERTSDVLRHVGLAEERHRPMGGYSTGMKQRAKLAQAIVHDPRLVLLDEPTNGLDPRARDDMLELIGTIGHSFGISVAVTSHLLGELERTADHVVVIDSGRLLRASATSDLTHSTGDVLVEVLGPSGSDQRIGQALLDRGLQAWPQGDKVAVRISDPAQLDVVRDTVVDLDLGLVRIQEIRHTLEEVFHQQGAPA
ncbi:ABC transporter ATP-binding protein [Luteipulveratus halotolerans]|uniref:ABC transporter n=1 Tax=Luteipulveratus halotolerans TaxID=1631356 RepID=A0A0L6CL93_9MICO|nr:ABC transporter ATP-binding protein [Luteipulveratus halotolerans]KNX38415.1 ABC transporter [Luteipulveratus halotolerans]